MKKLLFSAMACIAFAGSAFASKTATMIPKYPCEIYITITDRSTGEILELVFDLSKIGGIPCLERGAELYKDYVGLYPNADVKIDISA